MRRPSALLAPALLVAAVLAGCGDDDAGGDGAPDDPDPTADTASDSRYDDVAALAADLDGVAGGCTLEYEGLVDDQRELSVCTLGDEIAELSVWDDDAALDALVDAAEESGDPVVTGENWSVDVADTGLAAEVADATGGAVHP